MDSVDLGQRPSIPDPKRAQDGRSGIRSPSDQPLTTQRQPSGPRQAEADCLKARTALAVRSKPAEAVTDATFGNKTRPLEIMGDVKDKARVEDVHELAESMPHVTVTYGSAENPVYQVGGKSFVFFRTARPDAFDPVTRERYDDVIVFWVASEADKQALVQDDSTPFFTTPHFDGHPSVLIRARRLGEITRAELAEIIQDAWLSRASQRRADAWLKAHRTP